MFKAIECEDLYEDKRSKRTKIILWKGGNYISL